MNKRIIFCGIGGQGILFASNLIGSIADAKGWNVKVLDLMGLGQTGGSVVSHISISDMDIHSPRIMKGQADFIIALESFEALRQLSFLKDDGIVLVNDYELIPNTVSNDLQTNYTYSGLQCNISKSHQIISIPGYAVLKEKGIDQKSLNSFFVGLFFKWMGIKLNELLEIICEKHTHINEENIKAIKMGFNH